MSGLITALQIGYSKTPEAAFDTMKTLQADFDRALTTERNYYIPNVAKINDLDKIGGGSEFKTTQRNNYWQQRPITMADDLNLADAAVFLRRAMGAAAVDTVLTAGQSWQHDLVLATVGSKQLPSTTIAMIEETIYDMLLSGMCVNTWSLEYEAGGIPKYSAQLIGSGRWKRASLVTPVALVLPALVAPIYLDGFACSLNYNDGTAQNISSRVKRISLQLNNNLKTGDGRPGDQYLDPLDCHSGGIYGRIERQRRTITLTVTLDADASDKEFDAHRLNTILTNVTLEFLGCPLGTSADKGRMKFVIAKGDIDTLEPGVDGDNDTTTFTLTPRQAAVYGTELTARVDTGVATLV